MLFDLQGKRKRFVQVIYAGLALLIGGGLVLFGIGGAGSGGLLDAVGIGGGSSSSSSNYQDQIDKANEALQSNPKNERALLQLARYEFLKGQEERDIGDNGQYQLTEGTITAYEDAAVAWQRYLATKPKDPNDDVAGLMVQVYPLLYTDDTAQQQQILDHLVTAAQIVAEARPALGTYQDLATYAYYAQNDAVAKDAAKKAIAEAPDPNTRKQIEQALKQAQTQAKLAAKQEKQQAKAAGQQGTGALPDPTAALGGASGTSTTP
jgi:tetratricopeptide (TPR) repeat protein